MHVKFLSVFLVFLLTVPLSAKTDAENPPAEAGNWRAHMTELAKALEAAFPFLYSKSEFMEPANRKSILESLNRISATTHSLPKDKGDMLLGVEPLFESAQNDIKKDLERAIGLYEGKKFSEAQGIVHHSIQKCFACHTAHQVGPAFPAINAEVLGVATPFALEKAVVFGALRQFDGAMNIAEKISLAAAGKNSQKTIEAAKLQMIVSLRAMQNFPRAQKFVGHLKNKDKTNSKIYTAWLDDIKSWKNNPEKPILTTAVISQDPAQFVAVLQSTYLLHRKLSANFEAAKEKAATLLKLAEAYKALDVSALSHLAGIYYRACAKAAPDSPAGLQCLDQK